MVTVEAMAQERGSKTEVTSVLELGAKTVSSSAEATGAELARESGGSLASMLARVSGGESETWSGHSTESKSVLSKAQTSGAATTGTLAGPCSD